MICLDPTRIIIVQSALFGLLFAAVLYIAILHARLDAARATIAKATGAASQ